jgi:NADH:ubiquinone oxidoreductase subunit F (NADH-binding)/NADH:ubiquinone oxidoreductase subunit E
LGKCDNGLDSTTNGNVMIVQQLHAIQERRGYLPREELVALAARLECPLYRIEEVVSFFPHFRKEPPGEVQVRVCRDMACRLRGSDRVVAEMREAVAGRKGWSVCEVSCLGRCDRAPAAVVETVSLPSSRQAAEHEEYLIAPATQGRLAATVATLKQGKEPPHDSDASYRTEAHRSWQIEAYPQATGIDDRYQTIRQFLALNTSAEREAFRDQVLTALETGNLLGMGGAGGRSWKKWGEVRGAQGERKYVVCNADESEPATFKDRELLLRTPHLVLEGVILGGLVVGAERGFIYIRHEFHEQIAAMRAEIARAEQAGLCGDDMLGGEHTFRCEVFVSPGGYICGEQTALIEAMEDKRAEPRNRPPELQTNGLWDSPTLLNNVETLAWTPAIVQRDAGEWFKKAGATSAFKGRRFFSVSGDVAQPGPYEVPIGITLGELIDDYCGGMRAGSTFKAAALSGPSGGFMPAVVPAPLVPEALKAEADPDGSFPLRRLRLDIAFARKVNWMLGAGLVIYGDDADLVEQAHACTTFYRYESCGKCVPCRVGTQKLLDITAALYRRELTAADLARLTASDSEVSELAQTMKLTAICGLGTVAFSPLTSLLRYFPHEIQAYLKA